MKGKKIKPKYSIRENLIYVFKNIWKWDKRMLLFCVLRIPCIVLLPLLTTYLSKFVVKAVTDYADMQTLFLYILVLSLGMLLLNLLNNFADSRIEWRAFRHRFQYLNQCNLKNMDADYENIESPDGMTKRQKAFNTVYNNNAGTQQILGQMVTIGSDIIGIITYSAIILTLNPLIILLLSAATMADYFLMKANSRWIYRKKDHWIPIDRKMAYVETKSGDFEQAKDIRLYNMSGWFVNIFSKFLSDRTVWLKKCEYKGFAIDTASAVLAAVRDIIAYGYLIYRIYYTGLPADDFVLYFGVIWKFSEWLFGLFGAVNALDATSLGFCDLREFLEMPDRSNRGNGRPIPANTCEISFRNVCYSYPNSDTYALRDVNFTISKGEKTAIVGVNGAGKTTLVKLLCGLYHPTAGLVLIDGHRLEEYNRDEYFKLFSAVFQDIHLMPVSVLKNIALSAEQDIDRRRVLDVLRLSGLYDKVQSLPDGMDTLLLKSIRENAVDLSGGEKQKLALARALYKEGKIIVLDEPTAALDPIAENEMYLKYNELTAGRTSIFISHRLSSTRFCDRIVFLENGTIVESGSHDELMRQNGKYAEMYAMQSHYYKEAASHV